MFWTVGLLFKHFGTCGVELWDREIKALSNTQSQIERQQLSHPSIPPLPLVSPVAPPMPLLSLPPPPFAPVHDMTENPVSSLVTIQPALPKAGQVLSDSKLLTKSYSAPPPPSSLITLVNNTSAHMDTNNNISGGNNSSCTLGYEIGKRYTGCVTDWRQTYGFLSCILIPGQIFLHSQNLTCTSSSDLPVGSSVNFELCSDKATGRFRAIRAKAYM